MAMNRKIRLNSGSSTGAEATATMGVSWGQEAQTIQGIVTQLQQLYGVVSHNPQAVAYLNTAIFNLGCTVGVLGMSKQGATETTTGAEA